MIAPQPDRFLSEEDLDLQNMTREELVAWWNLWLEQAQIANEIDRDEYSHGVFRYGLQVRKIGRQTADDRRRTADDRRRTEEKL